MQCFPRHSALSSASFSEFMERLQEQYNTKISEALKKAYGFKNAMQVPKVTKVVINVGVGKFKEDKKKIDAIVSDIAKISGQAPVQTKARKSIAGFKVRENQIVGITVTLRGYRMYSFLDKLVNVALPRVRDFQGLSAQFDGRGNYQLGMKEQLVFPEISASALDNIFGLQVTVVTNAGKDEPAKELLKLMGFPFKHAEQRGN